MLTQRLFTLPYLTCRFSRPMGQLESAIRDLGIDPALSLNGVVYYTADDERRIDEELRQRDIERIKRGG